MYIGRRKIITCPIKCKFIKFIAFKLPGEPGMTIDEFSSPLSSSQNRHFHLSERIHPELDLHQNC